ncbi:vascular endothelial growth factor receptor 1-like [Copidosoma floridanum]|uniref:vascular endothelial growth factor receptor 1-like n=1 Tax=Copidosoma floridanum TaxID=29053 RepID=UPI0006C9DE60|nr:vascular endothelial growth factor receptor 1-like [Copidosoma floridanum]
MKSRKKIMRKQLSKAGLAYFKEGAVDLINPKQTVNEQAKYLPYDKKLEFFREKLKLGEQLGSGAFGVVVKAETFGICTTEPVTIVAVKVVHENAERVYYHAFVRELKIMMNLGQHLNVAQNSNDSIQFRSASYSDDLQTSWHSNYEGNYQNWNAECICSHDLLSWAYQVAHGIKYLSRRNDLHCDLAARNILLSTNNIVKICDFGLAQTLYKDINYTRLHDVKLPYKWMTIEYLRDGVFSTKSDIWSFGILIWEFFTFAETPYPGMQASVVYEKLIDGYRMGQPRYATRYLYNIMLNCWEDEPTLRRSFTKLSKNIGMLLDKSTRMHFEKLYQE